MRELRPLNLPKMALDRSAGASLSCEDVTATKSSVCGHASAGSISSASDLSGPTTPTFSVRGHSRFPSSGSSMTSNSTSPVYEHIDNLGSTCKLPMPQLPEEPAENEEDVCPRDDHPVDSFDSYRFDDVDRSTILLRESHGFDAHALDDYSGRPAPCREVKHQRSMDTFNTLSLRLNSFTKKFTSRKNAALPAGLGIQTSNFSGPASSRSSSLTSAHFPGFDQNDVLPPTPAMSVSCISTPASPVDEVNRLSVEEPFDRRALSSTPLLPPMMTSSAEAIVEPVYSPLQSPTIADPNKTFSMVSSTTYEAPRVSALPSPPLSSKPSISSFQRGRTSTFASVPDVPPMYREDAVDEWSVKLGHANFTIDPAPYRPSVCDAETCQVLVMDWETARQQYFKYRARVVEHYGAGSKTFKLTEEKWRSIDAQWRENVAFASAQASLLRGDAMPVTPVEPAPLTNMPTICDPRYDGKFPTLGDQDIVGPMEVAPPLPQTMPSSPSGKLHNFFRSMFGRSRSATR
ncbi:uncharacterized protein PV09_03752 [Verruconis gallopava]|uniref:Only prolin and serin are matching in the corresponding protein n=1 Tax=Verruconis gallopava TaxID=253628 RepID=A0A0D2B1J5_9PEZI|nr:uncharacterized protein PV09_03752 [Verruconis gallopava]KIW05209.1 hypothetical protein PV09_03752 [Verruconis gallopava]